MPAFVRSDDEVRAIAAHEPFPAEVVEASAGKLQVVLLTSEPRPQARRQVLAMAGEDDRLEFRGRELFWLPSGGLLESELDLDAVADVLGMTTTRTKGTVDQIAAKFFGD